MARLPTLLVRSNHERISPATGSEEASKGLPWEVIRKARAMEHALESWLLNSESERKASLPAPPAQEIESSHHLEIVRSTLQRYH